MNNETRNELLANLAAFASTKGIDPTTAEGRNTVRSLAITILVKDFGLKMPKAYNIIWGDGAYEKMIEQVYTELKNEAAA